MKNNLSIVTATLNESENIEKLYTEIYKSLKNTNISWELIFVDDNSTDDTVKKIDSLQKNYENVFLIRRFDKRGLSSALLQGALSSKSKYIVFMDADLQHNPKYIQNLFEKIKNSNANVVSASRFLTKNDFLNKKRYKASIIVNKILEKLTKIKFTDILTGYFIIEKDFLLQNINKLSKTGFKILLDIILSSKENVVFREIAFNFEPRYKGKSKLNNKVLIDFIYLLLDKYFGKLIPARYIIFSFIGLIGAIFQIFIIYALFQLLGFNTSLFLGIIFAMTLNFTLNNEFTYSDLKLRGLKFFIGLSKFYFFCSFGALFNFLTAKNLYENFNTFYIAILLGAFVGSVWNYYMNTSFNWKNN